MTVSSIGARGFEIFHPEVPGGARPPGREEPHEPPSSPHENGNDPEQTGTPRGGETTPAPAPARAGARPATSSWPTAYAMNRLPTRYGPSQDNRNVMVDYEHPGKTEFIIVNDRAYPVKNEGGQYRTYDSAHPERPSHGVSVDANGQWQISQGLKGGGQDPDQSASGGNNPFGQPAVPPQHPPQPPQPQNFNDFLGMAFGMQNLQHQQQHLQAMQAMQQQGAGGNAGQGAGGGNAGPWGAPGNPAQGGAGGQG